MTAPGSATVSLPTVAGELVEHRLREPGRWPAPTGRPALSRVGYAAAHVVADPYRDAGPGGTAAVDWDSTLAFRRHLWSYGLGVAEAMDTAQRGTGLDWPATQELVRRSAAEARAVGGRIVVGVGTDQAPPVLSGPGAVIDAYTEQLEFVRGTGAGVVLMASRQLAALGAGPDDYAKVYGRVIEQAGTPVLLHWLGTAFDPALAGYWGSHDLDLAAGSVLALIRSCPDRIDGIKVSLLDARREVALRRALPAGVKLYTGDDFDYPDLILGDGYGHSHALLGIFDAIAPAAAAALAALDGGDVAAYRSAFAPTLPLARHVFAAPTPHYKAGLVFLAWLNGHQPGFTLLGGLASARGAVHLGEVLRLADAAGLLADPELAAARWRSFADVAGIW